MFDICKPFMRRLLSLTIIFIFFSYCRPESEKCCGDEAFKKRQDVIAEEYHNWEVFKDKLYILSDTNTDSALIKLQTRLDSIIKNPTTGHFPPDKEKLSDLHFMKGEFLYKGSDFENAVIEFSFSAESDFERAKQIAQDRINQLESDSSQLKSRQPLPTRRTHYINEYKKLNGL
jgi:hypothetical protein